MPNIKKINFVRDITLGLNDSCYIQYECCRSTHLRAPSQTMQTNSSIRFQLLKHWHHSCCGQKNELSEFIETFRLGIVRPGIPYSKFPISSFLQFLRIWFDFFKILGWKVSFFGLCICPEGDSGHRLTGGPGPEKITSYGEFLNQSISICFIGQYASYIII